MIFSRPAEDALLDQGDILDDCPLLRPAFWDLDREPRIESEVMSARVITLTQTCDLANDKVSLIVVAVVRNAEELIRIGALRAADVKGPIRALRIWGYYFLPQAPEFGLPEMIVDLRHLHTVRLDMLNALIQRGKRRARLQPLYREHLNKFFADTYSRIGLPQPYETA